jgi:aspartate kinase
MSHFVQKFGGTSLGTAERMKGVAQIIVDHLKQHHRVTAVVSAMSSYNKIEGTTSRLLEAGSLALRGGPFYRMIDLVEESHNEALSKAIHNPEIQKQLREFVHRELRLLESFLEAIHVIREISPRSQDLIVGVGERLSAKLLSGVLQDLGIDAEYVDLSEALPEGGSAPEGRALFPYLQHQFSRYLPKETGRTAVITGFFGFVPGGIIDRVGRGYTDLTAALIAAETKANELQVWKEVDGIYSADPRKIPTASVLPEISPAEAAELTYFGSEVLHPFTMECAIKANVPIRIKNTFYPEKPGTIIVPGKLTEQRRQRDQTAVAVTIKHHISILNIHSNRMLNSTGFMAQVFELFKKHRVVIDLISTSEVNISCTVDRLDNIQSLIHDMEEFADVTLIRDRAILSLVGEGMHYATGTAGRMFMALAHQQINLEMITQGASEINISCVIQQEDSPKALRIIHQTFLESNTEDNASS